MCVLYCSDVYFILSLLILHSILIVIKVSPSRIYKYIMSQKIQTLITVVDEIVQERTDYDTIEDLDNMQTVEIEGGIYMNLHVTCECEDVYTIAHYRDGDARKPDPMIQGEIEKGEFEPFYLQDSMQYEEDTESVKRFMNNIWAENLRSQFL